MGGEDPRLSWLGLVTTKDLSLSGVLEYALAGAGTAGDGAGSGPPRADGAETAAVRRQFMRCRQWRRRRGRRLLQGRRELRPAGAQDQGADVRGDDGFR